MSFDELQAAWQSQAPGPQVNLDMNVLLKEVQQKQRELDKALFRRDAMEIIVAAFLTVMFLAEGIRKGDWALCLLGACCCEVGGFLLVDRWIQHRRRPASDVPLQVCIKASLMQVNHQVWLLRNILWWYLLPIAVGLTAVIGSVAWKKRHDGLLVGVVLYTIFCILLFWGIYWLNQKAIERHLVPRRKELENLLESLKQDEAN